MKITRVQIREIIREQLIYEQRITVGDHSMEVELAKTPEDRAIGLMYREELPQDSGMLFDFPDSAERSFHMRNTAVPLTIAFADAEGAIRTIKDMHPYDESPVHSDCDARYALEVPQGYLDEKGIGIGDVIGLEPQND